MITCVGSRVGLNAAHHNLSLASQNDWKSQWLKRDPLAKSPPRILTKHGVQTHQTADEIVKVHVAVLIGIAAHDHAVQLLVETKTWWRKWKQVGKNRGTIPCRKQGSLLGKQLPTQPKGACFSLFL